MSLIAQLLHIAMPQLEETPTKWAVFHYFGPLDIEGEAEYREATEWEFDTFDEAADKAEDLDASETRTGHWYGVDEVEVGNE